MKTENPRKNLVKELPTPKNKQTINNEAFTIEKNGFQIVRFLVDTDVWIQNLQNQVMRLMIFSSGVKHL